MKPSVKMFAPLIAAILTSLPAALPAQTLLIRNATVHTQASQGVLLNTDVLVLDGSIQEIGSELSAPADAQIIEAAGLPLTPGLFAGISSIGLAEISLEDSTVDQGFALDLLRPEFDVTSAFNPNSTLINVTRIEGFSWTLLGARAMGSIIGGQGQPASLDGSFNSLMGGPVLFVNVGSDTNALSGGSRAAQWMLLNQAVDESQSEMNWSPQSMLTPAGRKAIALYTGGGTVVFNVDRASDILQVLAFTSEQSMNPVISGGGEAWMVADALAESGTPVILDPLENLPSSFDMLGARLDNAAILHDAGVTVIFSLRGMPGHNARRVRQAAGVAAANGLPFDAALAAMTINPADVFGLSETIGSLEPGKKANMVLWSGDPLEVTTVADQVILEGIAVEMVSRQTLLRDRYLPETTELPRAYIKP
jgi:hypothetical protein